MFPVQIQFGRMPGCIEAFAVVGAHGSLVVSLYVQFHPVHPPAPGLGYYGIHQRFADVLSPVLRKDHQVFDVQVRPFPGGKPFEIDRAAHDLPVRGFGYQGFEKRAFRFEAFFPQVVGIPDDHLRSVVLFGQVLDQAEDRFGIAACGSSYGRIGHRYRMFGKCGKKEAGPFRKISLRKGPAEAFRLGRDGSGYPR